jgi:hypothetical protein
MNHIVQFHSQSAFVEPSAEVKALDSMTKDNFYLRNWSREIRRFLPVSPTAPAEPGNPIFDQLSRFGFIHINSYIEPNDLLRFAMWIDKEILLNIDRTFAAVLPPSLFAELHAMLGVVPRNNTNNSILEISERYFLKSSSIMDAIRKYLHNDPICIGNQLVHWTNIFASKGAGYWHRDLGGTLLKAYFCISAANKSYPLDIVPFPLLDPAPRAYEIQRPTPLEQLISTQDFIEINMSPGDLIIFDTNCIHRGRYFESHLSQAKHHRTIMQVFLTNRRVDQLVRENPFKNSPMHRVIDKRNSDEWNEFKDYSFPDAETAVDMALSAEHLNILRNQYIQGIYL